MNEKDKYKLTIKQEKFCNYYVESGNASDAYRKSYNCLKMKQESVNNKAYELLGKVEITARVKQLQNELKTKSDVTKEMVLSEFVKVGFSSIAHLHNNWLERKEFDKLTDDQKASIKSISTKIIKKNFGTNDCPEIVDVEYVKIELYDKLKALENINKMLGFEAPEKSEISFPTAINFILDNGRNE